MVIFEIFVLHSIAGQVLQETLAIHQSEKYVIY